NGRRWKAVLLGMGAAFLVAALISTLIVLANPQADLTPLVLVMLVVSLPTGGMLGGRLFHRALVRFRYHPSQGTVAARFRNQQYTDYLLSLKLEAGEAR